MSVYELTARLIEKTPKKNSKVKPKACSALDKILTWAEGFGYESYLEKHKKKPKMS